MPCHWEEGFVLGGDLQSSQSDSALEGALTSEVNRAPILQQHWPKHMRSDRHGAVFRVCSSATIPRESHHLLHNPHWQRYQPAHYPAKQAFGMQNALVALAHDSVAPGSSLTHSVLLCAFRFTYSGACSTILPLRRSTGMWEKKSSGQAWRWRRAASLSSGELFIPLPRTSSTCSLQTSSRTHLSCFMPQSSCP